MYPNRTAGSRLPRSSSEIAQRSKLRLVGAFEEPPPKKIRRPGGEKVLGNGYSISVMSIKPPFSTSPALSITSPLFDHFVLRRTLCYTTSNSSAEIHWHGDSRPLNVPSMGIEQVWTMVFRCSYPPAAHAVERDRVVQSGRTSSPNRPGLALGVPLSRTEIASSLDSQYQSRVVFVLWEHLRVQVREVDHRFCLGNRFNVTGFWCCADRGVEMRPLSTVKSSPGCAKASSSTAGTFCRA